MGQVVEQAVQEGGNLRVHVADDDAFASLCCDYCGLSITTYDDVWDPRKLDQCPAQKVCLRCCATPQLPGRSPMMAIVKFAVSNMADPDLTLTTLPHLCAQPGDVLYLV